MSPYWGISANKEGITEEHHHFKIPNKLKDLSKHLSRAVYITKDNQTLCVSWSWWKNTPSHLWSCLLKKKKKSHEPQFSSDCGKLYRHWPTLFNTLQGKLKDAGESSR